MIIEFANCTAEVEILYLVLFGIAIFLVMISGLMVFSNEKGESSVIGVFSALTVFFTDKHLNQQGSRWRPIYIFSILSLIILTLIGKYFQLCG